jgi:polyisoprenoid-binding protein YceI
MHGILFTLSLLNYFEMKTTEEKNAATKLKWEVDKEHSEISFRVKHMMITNVTGIISDYEIHAESSGARFADLFVEFTGRTNSISTGNEKRDEHLKSADFFDTKRHPEIRFTSTNFKKTGDAYELNGDLTIGDVTRNISLNVTYNGLRRDPWGKVKAGFSVTGSINRADFGLTWNNPLEGGGVLVGNDVAVACEIQMIQVDKVAP